jgi:hypothetical protein
MLLLYLVCFSTLLFIYIYIYIYNEIWIFIIIIIKILGSTGKHESRLVVVERKTMHQKRLGSESAAAAAAREGGMCMSIIKLDNLLNCDMVVRFYKNIYNLN